MRPLMGLATSITDLTLTCMTTPVMRRASQQVALPRSTQIVWMPHDISALPKGQTAAHLCQALRTIDALYLFMSMQKQYMSTWCCVWLSLVVGTAMCASVQRQS